MAGSGPIIGPMTPPPRSNVPVARSAQVQMAERERRRAGSGLDFTSRTTPSGVAGYQEPVPDLDIRSTWGPKEVDGKMQQGFALTIRSQRAGLEMQRDFVDKAHARQAESTLVAHGADQLILPFRHDFQTVPSVQPTFITPMLHAVWNGRRIWAQPGMLATGSVIKFWRETSILDPTIVEIGLGTSGNGVVTALGVVNAGSISGEILLIGIDNIWHYSTTENLSGTNQLPLWQVQPATPSDAGIGQYSPTAFLQSPAPGNPLILSYGGQVFLQPTETDDTHTTFLSIPATRTAEGRSGGRNYAIDFMQVGARKPKAYFLTSFNGIELKMTSCDALGLGVEFHELSLNPIYGAAGIRARGAIALTSGRRVILWDGKEKDLGIFYDEKVPDGSVYWVAGLSSDNGQLYAYIDELPAPELVSPYPGLGSKIGVGRIRHCKRRYDFEIGKWHQISDWETLTEEGTIRWDLWNVPIAYHSPTDNKYGYTTMGGAPDIGMGPNTRAMHTTIVKSSLTGSVAPQNPLGTFMRKFEPTPATNPYSYNGSDQNFSASGRSLSPGYMFPGEALYADKYVDEIWSSGIDSGGVGSSWAVRVAEFGHMDDVDSNGNRTALEAIFKTGLSHADRRRNFPTNKTSYMIPQVEHEIIRGSESNLTPQALTTTIYFHVDLPTHDEPDPQSTGRSNV